jgi:heme-degrading monooxygenase HmoA
MHVNYIDWHVIPFRAEQFLEAWRPAIDRALAAGATACYVTRDVDDPLHFRQVSVWERTEDFEAWWASDEIAEIRRQAMSYYHKPVLPNWHTLSAQAVVENV